MSQLPPCPNCGGDISRDDSGWHCQGCEQAFKRLALCDKCGAELERLAACGSVSYFCNSCNELKSKSSVQYAWEPVGS